MGAIDIAPFIFFFVVGAVCGRWIPGAWAWAAGLGLPVGHFLVSIASGRAGQDLLSYVVPVNVILICLAAVGLLSGRSWRRRARSQRP